MKKLKKALLEWDGKTKEEIQKIFDLHCSQTNFVDDILNLISNNDIQNGATWLLKAWFESGSRINNIQSHKVYSELDLLHHWEAKLHVLQCISYMHIDNTVRKKVEMFLRITLTDHNKFLRAWTYNGFYFLAIQHNQYLDETKQIFKMAMDDEVASVQARVRILLKKGFD